MAHLALNVAALSSALAAPPHSNITASASSRELQTLPPILVFTFEVVTFERIPIAPPAPGELKLFVPPAPPSFQNAYRIENVPLLPSKSRNPIGDTPNGLFVPVSL
jgi:hypothetical protein